MKKRIRRSLFTASVLLAMVALLAPAAAQAQPGDVTGIMAAAKDYETLTVSWTYAHSGDLSTHADTLMGLGFNVYYTKGTDVTLLNTVRKISGAMEKDAGLGKAASRMTSTSPAGTSFEYDLEGLDPATSYVISVLPYSGDLSTVDTDPIPTANMAKTADAPRPSRPREVMVMPGDKMLTVSWRPPVRVAGGSTGNHA